MLVCLRLKGILGRFLSFDLAKGLLTGDDGRSSDTGELLLPARVPLANKYPSHK